MRLAWAARERLVLAAKLVPERPHQPSLAAMPARRCSGEMAPAAAERGPADVENRYRRR